MACPNCGSKDVRRTEEHLNQDDYICNTCNHEWEKASPSTMRFVLALAVAALTGGTVALF
ncbi:primase-helicase zinc-binding domain-containing protein [Maricaulis sp.]|uniref:primase-helicase zinc-binding domain-containing protein n=1 Tax=Maricaulis sp. TaxID=1486257 RepID=UPI0034338A62